MCTSLYRMPFLTLLTVSLSVASSSKRLEMSGHQPQSWRGVPYMSRAILLSAQADGFQWKLFLLNITAFIKMPTFWCSFWFLHPVSEWMKRWRHRSSKATSGHIRLFLIRPSISSYAIHATICQVCRTYQSFALAALPRSPSQELLWLLFWLRDYKTWQTQCI